jgi:hypothetical protein
MERIDILFASKRGQYLIYACLQPIATYVTQDATPKSIEAWLMLSYRTWK